MEPRISKLPPKKKPKGRRASTVPPKRTIPVRQRDLEPRPSGGATEYQLRLLKELDFDWEEQSEFLSIDETIEKLRKIRLPKGTIVLRNGRQISVKNRDQLLPGDVVRLPRGEGYAPLKPAGERPKKRRT